MKLLTEMVELTGRPLPRKDIPSGAHFAIEHDAAAAHALIQAMHDINTARSLPAIRVIRRADELMRQWGFTDE